MKILHVETGRHLYGGPQQVLYLVSALAARGVEGVLVCPAESGIDTAARAAGIEVRNLACAGDLDLLFAMRLRHLIAAERPDVVHCHSRRGADLMGGLAARLAGVPAVVSRRVDNREPALVARLRYRPFERVIAISEAVAAALSAQGVDPARVVRIRSAVDWPATRATPDCARFRREFDVPDDALVIAAAGQLIPRKGHRHLVAAFARLVKTGTRARLLIFGAGPLLGSLERQVRELGLDDLVGLPGFRDDLDTFLACIDILAHPALAEGLGIIVLKAAAAGVPVVATAAGGLPEAVVDGETGLLVPAGDDAALADALGTLAGDPPMRRRFGASGRERMQKAFSVATMAVSTHRFTRLSPMADHESIYRLAEAVVTDLTAAQKSLAVAESCTGGWIAKAITDVPGSSAVFGYGIVSYSNGAKESLLGVASGTLDEHGAVSEPAVREMVSGIVGLSGADFGIAVSGVAGPDGGTPGKPVGTVCFAWAVRTGSGVRLAAGRQQFAGDRELIRELTVVHALQGILDRIQP